MEFLIRCSYLRLNLGGNAEKQGAPEKPSGVAEEAVSADEVDVPMTEALGCQPDAFLGIHLGSISDSLISYDIYDPNLVLHFFHQFCEPPNVLPINLFSL